MTRRDALSLAILALALCASCSSKSDGPSPGAAPVTSEKPAPEPAKAPVTVVVAYGSEKKTWLEEQAQRFEALGEKTKSGRPIHIEPKAMGSGEAVQSITSGELKAHAFSPASAVYISLLNNAWSAKTGRPKPLSPAGDPLVLSPIVVAMWKPMAEALGWPGKPIGWSNLIKVSADPKGWGALGHPEWGRFKLGHTHPEYSNSGLLAVLAEAYAGARKTRGLTAADLDAKPTQDYLRTIEQTLVHYGKSTGFFGDKMLARGPAYLSAAVLYENLVIESYAKRGDAPFPIVAVYPVEGTFWSDHPYAVLDAEWVGSEEREGAQAFLQFLKEKPQQERALALGFRPADPSIPIGAPVDADHGVDPKQPQTLLGVPDGATLEKLLGVWQSVKKTSDVILVFDKSGSMAGKPLAEAKNGAKSFLDVLHDRDDVTLLFFDGALYPAIGPKQLGKDKAELVARIDGAVADGKTALYDAVARAYELALARAKAEPARIHAIVVMTDGKDEHSKLALDALMKRFSDEDAPVKVFTIAYGAGADPTVLEQIAEAAKGSSAKGATDTIVGVYKDMASFF
ncbi:substrate-binding and vWA domain-containing protein [Sorangium sp. So ce124]|uniref:substrate-binding and vWA domain-containing protein n=1 Tax=Sorangium sp. So ce124 TaxID=3133280 RepID=UPI003F601C76